MPLNFPVKALSLLKKTNLLGNLSQNDHLNDFLNKRDKNNKLERYLAIEERQLPHVQC